MAIDFVAIDFETANRNRASACSVGMTKIKDGVVVDNYYSLIDPETEFDNYNILIHGITPQMVEGERNYPQVVHDIITFSDGFPLVAHYAPFDIGVIRDSNKRYFVEDFKRLYFDSYYLSKQYIQSLNYKLSTLASIIGYPFAHHNALEDSKACAAVILYLCEQNGFSNLSDLIKQAGYAKFGELDGFGFRRKQNKWTKKVDIASILDSIEVDSLDPDHIFFQKNACFTGKLESMNREQAMKLFARCGGIPEKGVTKNTNFLIMGDQDVRIVGENGKSTKIKKAEKLLSSGQDIQLLAEYEFLQMAQI